MENQVITLLEKMELRKTNIRKEVLQMFLNHKGKALSSKEIEDALQQPDRITLYRTLKTFEQNGLVHQAVDSSGTTKYALCSEDCSTHEHHDEHAHFHCLICGKTVCLPGHLHSQVNLPEGYKITTFHIALEGECKECRR